MVKFCSKCGKRETLYSPPFFEENRKLFCQDCFIRYKKVSNNSKWSWLWTGMNDELIRDGALEKVNYCFICGEKENFLTPEFAEVNGCWFCKAHFLMFKKQGKFPTAEQIAEREKYNLVWVDFPDRGNDREILLAERNHDLACEKTNNRWMASFVHLGGHPYLPNGKRIILGLSPNEISFYNYNLDILHASSLSSVQATAETTHFSSTSFGSTYVPKGSTFGSTISNQRIDMSHPDTLTLSMAIKGISIQCQFDTRPFSALDYIQALNYVKLETA